MRASDDYLPGNTQYNQWQLQDSSLFSWAVGILPFKDSFWSTSKQPGSSNGENAAEPAPDMQAAISTFSTGPVTPSDGIGYSNVELINRSIRQDGLILKPNRPAVSLDSTYVYRAIKANGPDGFVAHTYSMLLKATSSIETFWHIFYAIDLTTNYDLYPSEAYISDSSENYIAVKYIGGSYKVDLSSAQIWNTTSPLPLVSRNEADFQVWYASPVLSNGMSVIGDISKWVPMSSQRYYLFDYTEKLVTVGLEGSPGEIVITSFYLPTGTIIPCSCTIGQSGMVMAIATVGGDVECSNL
jgi:hypothetical protein